MSVNDYDYGYMFKIDQKVKRKALELHFDALVVDQHCDIQMDVITRRGRLENKVIETHHLPKLKQGGIDCVLLSTVAHFGYQPYPFYMSPPVAALQLIDCAYMDVAESSDSLTLVTSTQQIMDAKKAGKVAIMLGIEGAQAVETELGLLRNYYRLGVRMMTLTWHQRNMVADGSGEPSDSGLSKFGRDLVNEMNRIGMIIDVSHMGEAGFWDTIKLSKRPIIASHSNARALCDHPRNLYDDQLTALAKNNGLVGMCFCAPYVHKQTATVNEVIDHIDHIADLIGVEHIALGPDWVDYAVRMVMDCMDPGGYLARGASITSFAKGLENAARLPNLTVGLMARGYSEKDIRGILGTNFIRFVEKAMEPVESI
ncbi:MAG: dipeptidase [Deltaproteobacteria bacterium]|nr:dipeptidase [Deltaproteobacteria bacterium]MBW2152662.1 dipeptidase [Deltaproteobacteria bacterium]